jgi:putative Mg2+ transporter-C (MgtC) family protein
MFELSAAIAPDFLLRLLVSAGLGALLGVERAFAHKTAGARTYALVCLGSTLFIIVSQIVVASYAAAGLSAIDPLRVASQIVVGIGFLGTGLIIFRRTKIEESS